MKKIFVIMLAFVTALSATLFVACSGNFNDSGYDLNFATGMFRDDGENYRFDEVEEQPFVFTDEQTQSYFSLDRNTASYSLMRRQIEQGLVPNKGSVRLEEYVNYFNYDYVRPVDGKALAIGGNLFDCPWNDKHKLLSFAIAAKELQLEDTANNLVFLIDTSGSMYGSDRLGLIQQAFVMLLDSLGANDTVSVVTYAGDSRVALDGANGSEKLLIANVIEDLTAAGSTNGEGGIETAYAIAERYFTEGGNNRVILATDGDFNVGTSTQSGLRKLIGDKARSGIYLSVLGVGMLNTDDRTMSTLAVNGNGNYAYLDSVLEAKKVLVNELGGTLGTVAKDAKIGVEFNKNAVEKFRLLGYESKLLTQEQFDDESADAGEIGAGHTVTAVYEIELKEGADGDIATAELRYKLPDNDSDPDNDVSDSVSLTVSAANYTAEPNDDCVFIGCVLEFGLLLRESEYKADAAFISVLARLQTIADYTEADEFKSQFVDVVQKALTIYGEA